MPQSMESKLSAALSPVEAPGELWTRVNAALPPVASGRPLWPNLLMAAAIAALMTGGVLYLRASQTQVETALASAAIAVHQGQPGSAAYVVQRHMREGQSVTIVSIAATSGAAGRIRTLESGTLAVSEWAAGGRRWAMVTSKLSHRQACSLCHRA